MTRQFPQGFCLPFIAIGNSPPLDLLIGEGFFVLPPTNIMIFVMAKIRIRGMGANISPEITFRRPLTNKFICLRQINGPPNAEAQVLGRGTFPNPYGIFTLVVVLGTENSLGGKVCAFAVNCGLCRIIGPRSD